MSTVSGAVDESAAGCRSRPVSPHTRRCAGTTAAVANTRGYAKAAAPSVPAPVARSVWGENLLMRMTVMPVAMRPGVVAPKVAAVVSLEIVPLLMSVAVTVMVVTMWVSQMNVDLEVAGLRRRRGTDACKSDAGHKSKAIDKGFSTHAAPPSERYLLDARAC